MAAFPLLSIKENREIILRPCCCFKLSIEIDILLSQIHNFRVIIPEILPNEYIYMNIICGTSYTLITFCRWRGMQILTNVPYIPNLVQILLSYASPIAKW
ncbi:Uncharacterised protein [uncultured archaeon]|nr:Uncharacterised protein [uncultured archaeon]